ncbi:hypothetical protein GUJ93_ZPchr0010g7511 [Zizania palustris]|uniref:BED-type domain-containing protein n=1 Tax=Zizania palustris TaxID=103762 RepID=A0A8J5WF09_ZIZPA|nr:hypothetical protein GUJ93_ZPchr0010g7511 [Zizania palustris]
MRRKLPQLLSVIPTNASVLSNNEVDGPSINDELRLLGGTKDDEVDLGMERKELLGGHNSADPINIGGDAEDGGVAAGQEDSTQGSQKRSRFTTSDVWNDFKKIFKVIGGKNVRYEPKCNHCSHVYSALSIGDTGHLLRHRSKCQVSIQDNRIHAWPRRSGPTPRTLHARPRRFTH